jgi:hypothetical protein
VDNNISLQSISPNHGESPSPSGAWRSPAHISAPLQLTSVNRSVFPA